MRQLAPIDWPERMALTAIRCAKPDFPVRPTLRPLRRPSENQRLQSAKMPSVARPITPASRSSGPSPPSCRLTSVLPRRICLRACLCHSGGQFQSPCRSPSSLGCKRQTQSSHHDARILPGGWRWQYRADNLTLSRAPSRNNPRA